MVHFGSKLLLHKNKSENLTATLSMQKVQRPLTTKPAVRIQSFLPFLCPSIQVVNKPDSHGGSLDWTKICEKSSKVITFIDLAGHEKYLKTTVFGMTGHLPDFCMLMVRGRVLV